MFVCLFVCVFACLFVCLFVCCCWFVWLCGCLFVAAAAAVVVVVVAVVAAVVVGCLGFALACPEPLPELITDASPSSSFGGKAELALITALALLPPGC